MGENYEFSSSGIYKSVTKLDLEEVNKTKYKIIKNILIKKL